MVSYRLFMRKFNHICIIIPQVASAAIDSVNQCSENCTIDYSV